MTVQADSRYATGELDPVTLPDGTTSRMLWPPPIVVTNVQYQLYGVVEGDRFDAIALRVYGDATKWWMIADMNPEIIWPNDLVPGNLIRIPLPNTGDYSPQQTTAFLPNG